MKLRSCFAVLALVCCIATNPVQAGYYGLGGAVIAAGVSFLGAGGLLIGLGAKYVQDIAPQYNKSELVVAGYDLDSSGCSLCLPGGTSGDDGPCYDYIYKLHVANNYTAYINNISAEEHALTGSYCGNDLDRLRNDASKDFPLGSRTPIFYRMSDPKQWTYSLSALDPYRTWSAVPFAAGAIAVLAGVGIVLWERYRRTHGDYQQLVNPTHEAL